MIGNYGQALPFTSIGGILSNDFCILYIIFKSCELKESPGTKLEWQAVKSSFSLKYTKIDVNTVF